MTQPRPTEALSERIRDRWFEILLVALVLALAGYLRLRDLNRYVASDELRWVCRSIDFDAALHEGRPAETFQIGHPGVLTMWLGSLALPLDEAGDWRRLCHETEGGTDLSIFEDPERGGEIQTVAPLLWQLRRGVAVGTTLFLGLIYLLLRAGLGLAVGPALGGLVLLATDPFTLAHSRVLHVDMLLASSATAAVLGLGVALRGVHLRRDLGEKDPPADGKFHEHPDSSSSPSPGGGRTERSEAGGGRPWLLAGALAGLAMLAKSAGFALGPFAILCITYVVWRERDVRTGVRRFLLWGFTAALVYVLFWPAMWVNPIGTLFRECDSPCNDGVLVKLFDEGGVPHQNGNYFMGEPVADPGPLFYPAVVAFRTTPWGLLGILIALGLGLRMLLGRIRGEEDRALRHTLASLLTWALFFTLFISLGPKKMDRYLLPALVPLNLAAGIVLVQSVLWPLARANWKIASDAAAKGVQIPPLRGSLLPILVLVGIAEASSRRAWPYPLTYYNPLLGGARAAERVMLVGWGEGYDLAADYLNGLPNAENLVASSPGKANTAPLFVGHTRSLEGFEPGRTDYLIFYRSQVQRRKPTADDKHPLMLSMYHDDPAVEPAYTGIINGVEMTWVYRNQTIVALESRLAELTRPGDLLIAGGETVLARHYDGPLELHRYWGHWAEPDIEAELLPELGVDWEHAWVIRYPHYDPEATLNVLGRIAERGETERIDFADGSAVEITRFTRKPD